MKKLMREHFLPPNYYEQVLYGTYQNCRQWICSIADYVEEFHRLGARTNLAENEYHLITRFIEGLRMDVKEKVKLQQFHYLSDVILFVETVKEMNENHFKKAPRKSHREENSSKKKK